MEEAKAYFQCHTDETDKVLAASLRRLVKNLRDLSMFLQASHGKLMDRVKNGTDDTLKHEAAGIHGAHAMLMLEINRRLSQLDSVLKDIKQLNNALEDIGMTTAEYSKLKDIKQLNNALEDLLRKDFDKANFNELSKFMLAADVLRQNNLHQTDIVSYLNKKKT
jgi:hypothetical protein